jgi:hypothetical protein
LEPFELTYDTLLFCTSYFSDEAAWNSRYEKWLSWYLPLVPERTLVGIIDDGSKFVPNSGNLQIVDAHSGVGLESPVLIRFGNNLGRSATLVYPGWWRSFLHAATVAKSIGAKRIVHVESDAFIFSTEMLEFLFSRTSGWHVMWSPHYSMPETAIQVICEDAFDAMAGFASRPFTEFEGQLAEHLLPFTSVVKRFSGDRFSEIRKNRWILRSRKFDWVPIFKSPFFGLGIPEASDFATQVEPWQKLPQRPKRVTGRPIS